MFHDQGDRLGDNRLTGQKSLAERIDREIKATEAALDQLQSSETLKIEASTLLKDFLEGNVDQESISRIRKDVVRKFEQVSKTVFSASVLHKERLNSLNSLRSALEHHDKPPRNAQDVLIKSSLRTAECFKEFRAENGDRIFVGKGARDNEKLTMTIAKVWDVYMHVRNIPGAHVIIPREHGAENSTDLRCGAVDANTLSDAAQLAVFFSQANPCLDAEVHYTWRKNVQQQPGSATGEVDPGNDLILLSVKLNLDRLTDLLSNQVFPIQR
jgi:predicted ribosome quality control (RQC) complex YloA/Tae2 family protein